MRQQEIKLKLSAFDHRVLDQAVREIVITIKRTGAKVKGPVPIPRKTSRFVVNRSTHVDKRSGEHFEIRSHRRFMVIVDSSTQTIDALMKLDLASGVDVKIELDGKQE